MLKVLKLLSYIFVLIALVVALLMFINSQAEPDGRIAESGTTNTHSSQTIDSDSVHILSTIIEDESQSLSKPRMSALVTRDCLKFCARVLSDPASYKLWRRTRIAVSLSKDEGEAFSILRNHISTYVDFKSMTTSDHSQRSPVYAILEIPNTIYLMYNFPSSMTADFLLTTTTLEGASDLLSDWTNKPLPTGVRIEDMRHGLRYYAARALAIQNDPGYVAKLRAYYQELSNTASAHSEDSRFIETYTEVFAYVDIVAERGRDYALSLKELEMEERDRIIGKFALKHIDELPRRY